MENVFLAYFERLKNPLSHSLNATAYPGIVAGHVCSAVTGGGGIQQERCDVIMSTWTRSSDETSCGTQVNKNCY